MGYEDLQMGNFIILRVYYVEVLGHNLFSIGKFCDSDLKVALRKHTCFVHKLEGVDLLLGSYGSNIYTISMADMMNSSPICLLSKASKTKSWFGTVKQGLVKGLPKLKYTKDHLCSACQMGKSKKESHPHNPEPNTNKKLQMLHMDLCGPIRVESINGIKPKLHGLTSGYISSRLVQNQDASTSAKPPTKNDWDVMFQPMFDEYFKPSSVVSNPISSATLLPSDTARASSSISINKDASSPSTSPNNETTSSPISSSNFKPPHNEEVAEFDSDTFTNLFAPPDTSLAKSSSKIIDTSNMHTF
nr:copia protein [Tanacetum cinerariifolium]